MRIIEGKRALVTGAASGIGRAIALRLADEGADLCLLDYDEEGLEKVSDEAQRIGARTSVFQCDLAQPEQITAITTDLTARSGGVDILVNNAGVGYYGPVENMTGDEWQRLLAINLHAPIQLTRELLPTLMDRQEAHIVNVASIFGLIGPARLVAYATSKFGLVGFSEALRAELGRRGLGVTAMCPGFVSSPFFGNMVSGHRDRDVPVPPRWLSTTPEKVADKTVRAIYRNRRLVVMTPVARFMFWLKRFLPSVPDHLSHIGRRRAMHKKAEQLADKEINVIAGADVEGVVDSPSEPPIVPMRKAG